MTARARERKKGSKAAGLSPKRHDAGVDRPHQEALRVVAGTAAGVALAPLCWAKKPCGNCG